MSEELEARLKAALRPVDPGADFTARVVAAAGSATEHSRALRRRFASFALAASVLLVVLGAYGWRERQQEAGLAAREAVLRALRMTGEKLDLASRLVNAAPAAPAAADPDPGA